MDGIPITIGLTENQHDYRRETRHLVLPREIGLIVLLLWFVVACIVFP